MSFIVCSDIGFPNGWEFHQDTRGLLNELEPPGVEVKLGGSLDDVVFFPSNELDMLGALPLWFGRRHGRADRLR